MSDQILSAEILNAGLSFSMEFGENWLKPIDVRLQKSYSYLDASQLEFCDVLCKEVNETGNRFVAQNPEISDEENKLITFEKFHAFVISRYNWISDENSRRLYSQSCYYAAK